MRQSVIDKFLAELQRYGVGMDGLHRLRQAIDEECRRSGVRPSEDPITMPETPRAITSRRMPAVRIPLEDDPDSERGSGS